MIVWVNVACEQALLLGRVKRVSRERASDRRSREGPRPLAAHFAYPNRRACSQARVNVVLNRTVVVVDSD